MTFLQNNFVSFSRSPYGGSPILLGFAMDLPSTSRGPQDCHLCEIKCSLPVNNDDITSLLEDSYKNLTKSNTKSLLKVHLTRKLFDKIKYRKTSYGNCLLDCIQANFESSKSKCGICAPDPECYTVFAEIFEPIIAECHKDFIRQLIHPKVDWGNPRNLNNLDPRGRYVSYVRISCRRSISGYPFSPGMTRSQYLEIEGKASKVLKGLGGELKGYYRSMKEISIADSEQLKEESWLLSESNPKIMLDKTCCFWPSGRGVFFNKSKTFLTWVNEEDHLRFVSRQPNGDLCEAYRRLVNGIRRAQKKIRFARNDRFGYMTVCPTNLGTSLRVFVYLHLPKLAEEEFKLHSLAQMFELDVRPAEFKDDIRPDMFMLSNKRSLGLTEIQVLKDIHNGTTHIIQEEKSLENT